MARGKPFAKGASGNPGGRPKLDQELRVRAKKLVDDKVIAYWEDEITERQREIMTPAGPMDMVCRGKDAMKAAELLAGYGYGRPAQSIESKVDVTVNHVREMSRAQLLAIASGVTVEESADTEH